MALMMGIATAAQDQQVIDIICKDYLRGNDHPLIGDKNKNVCNSPEILAISAIIMSRLSAIKNIIGIFTVGFYTSQSDYYGRKYLVHMTLVPGAFSLLLIIYMNKPHSTLGLWPLYLNAILGGILGGGSLLEPSMNAYLADCTPRDRRSLAIGYIMVTLSIGIIVGPFIGYIIYEQTKDNSTVLMASLAASACCILYTIFLPESRPKEARIAETSRFSSLSSRYSKEPISFLGRMKQFISYAFEPILIFLPGRIAPTEKILPSPYTLLLLISTYAFGQFANNGSMAVFVPYSHAVSNH
ncbi:hypothetical protein FBU30_006431 [Linnemannia zychae]|nr:hypothetical protein FBU30_006431 [Linnemannia zychae]